MPCEDPCDLPGVDAALDVHVGLAVVAVAAAANLDDPHVLAKLRLFILITSFTYIITSLSYIIIVINYMSTYLALERLSDALDAGHVLVRLELCMAREFKSYYGPYIIL